MVWKGCLLDSTCLILNAGGCLDAGKNREMHRRKQNIFKGIRLQKSLPRSFQWNPYCALCRGFTAVPRDLQPQEKEMENYGAAVAAGWRRVCLCSPISAVTGNIMLRKQNPALPMYPSPGSKDQTGPLVFSILLLCFPPCQAGQSRHWHVQLPFPRFAQEGSRGCPGYPAASLWGATRAHSKSHQQKPPSHLVQVWPSSLTAEKERCQKSLPGASSSPGLLLCLLSHLSLAIGTCCTLPALLALPAASTICRVIFLGTFVLKMTRFLSFGRSLLAKVEISKPSQVHIAKLYPPYMIDCSTPVQFSTAHLPQSPQQQPGHSHGQSSLEAFRVIYSAHELSSHDCSKG